MASILFTLFAFLLLLSCEAQLSPSFYDRTCPNVFDTVRASVNRAISEEPRMAASLVRLHFHDCFVQGCDASILLDNSSTIQTEKTVGANGNSIRGFEVIEAVKREVESQCPGIVSCADILALAARDASVVVGGPTWKLRLGRRDSTTANASQAITDLPSATDDLDVLINVFSKKGFNATEMVVLSGAHTIGRARCITFRNRIYNDTNIDSSFANLRKQTCPQTGSNGNLAPFDMVTPDSFDNNYFKMLLQRKGLLKSDQALFNGGVTDKIVLKYSKNPKAFASDFAKAMTKMGEIQVLQGEEGIIRRACNTIN